MKIFISRLFTFILFLIVLFNGYEVQSQNTGMVTDTAPEFLIGDPAGNTIATAIPTIDFGVVDVGSATGQFTHWCNVVLGPDSLFYFSVGDHDPEGVVMLCSYDPVTKNDQICIDSRNIPGLKEGKWHGRPVISPDNGDLYLIGFFNGDIVYYNIYSNQVQHLGQPVPGSGFEEHIWDWPRNRLYGISLGSFLVYDTQNRSVIFHGEPKDTHTGKAIKWEQRARMLDSETGFIYGSDMDDNTIVRYDPANNTFLRMKSWLDASLRASTNVKEDDGSFWIFDRWGTMYKFFPAKDNLEYHGSNWTGNDGVYATFIERSPSGRYLYYAFAASPDGMPVVQYDVETGKKKVIAFLEDFYTSNYGYTPLQFYGGALSADGSSLFLVCNSTGNPGMFYIYIPESERLDEPGTSLTKDTVQPVDFTLFQNYPNPFNATTIIKYRLRIAGFVILTLYDINGREINTLVSEHKQAGNYKHVLGAGELVSGLYYYRLQLNNQHAIKKMIVIK